MALIAPQPGAKHTAAEQATDRMRSPTGRQAAVDRQAHAEGAISELKRHGADRARCRGTRLLVHTLNEIDHLTAAETSTAS